MNVIEAIRSLVRPVCTLAVMGVFLYMVVILGFRYADKAMSDNMMSTFGGIVGTIVGIWFGGRIAEKKGEQ